jgi:hypothetical protein
MEYLTPSQLAAVAPAARRLTDPDEKKLDTALFLRFAAKRGYRPVLAFQGKPHQNQGTPSKGRHLVISAKSNGEMVVLLNSHTPDRKAWLGVGFIDPAEKGFLIGAAAPVKRWKGYEAVWAELESYLPALRTGKEGLQAFSPDKAALRAMLVEFASTAYFPGYKQPNIEALAESLEATKGSAQTILFQIIAKLIKGGTAAKGRGERAVKPLRGPDALMNAACAAHRVGLSVLAHRKPPLLLAFPTYHKP